MTDEIAPLTLDFLVARTQEILASEMGKETVMLDVQKGAYFGMDEIGSTIWGMIKTPVRIAELCAALQTRFSVDAEECQRDVLAFLEDLKKQGLLNVQPAG
jgi:hypothetical protein